MRQLSQLVSPVVSAHAIAEGKVKVTVAGLERLIRLEEFPREDL